MHSLPFTHSCCSAPYNNTKFNKTIPIFIHSFIHYRIYGKNDENSSSENSNLNLLVDQMVELSDEEFEQMDEEIDSESDLAEGVIIIPIVDVINMSENNDDYNDIEYVLPKHQRCAAHTLNLIATKVSFYLCILN